MTHNKNNARNPQEYTGYFRVQAGQYIPWHFYRLASHRSDVRLPPVSGACIRFEETLFFKFLALPTYRTLSFSSKNQYTPDDEDSDNTTDSQIKDCLRTVELFDDFVGSSD